MTGSPCYRIGVDVGGTFTDFLLQPADAPPRAVKVPSTPDDPAAGVFAGLAEMAAGEGRPLEDFLAAVDVIVHGTTITTNAVLTGAVARVGLLTTRGFRDALAMRRGIREAQYDNRYRAPTPLVPRWLRLPVTERMDGEGRVLTPLDPADVVAANERFRAAGADAVAICFMHAWANDEHERAAEDLVAAAMPSAYVSRSSAILPQVRFTERVSTTVLNAAVGPVLGRYLDRLTGRLAAAGFRGALLVMQSNGGVATPDVARAVAASTLLSGPAAAPMAAQAVTAGQAMPDFVTVDMGGTSFDVCLVKDGAAAMTAEGRIGRYPFGLPMLAIHTIGAGGGSIGWIDDGGLLRMGPSSAGAQPGPACYGRGGALPTCTDADLVLGYLRPDYFLGGRLPLDPAAARRAVETLSGPLGRSVEATAAGMLEVITANMAAGIRHVTVEQGHDPRHFPLVVAGGAGPVHAGALARELGIGRVLIPRDSSIFCAAGMLFSDLRHDFVRSCVAPLAELDPARLRRVCAALVEAGDAALGGEGIPSARRRITLACDLRYLGQHHELSVPLLAEEAEAGDASGAAKRFHEAHDRLYGYALPGTPLELVNVRAAATGITSKPSLPDAAAGPPSPTARGRRPIWLAEAQALVPVPVYDGTPLGAATGLRGPAVVELPMTTVIVPPGATLAGDRHGSFVMELG